MYDTQVTSILYAYSGGGQRRIALFQMALASGSGIEYSITTTTFITFQLIQIIIKTGAIQSRWLIVDLFLYHTLFLHVLSTVRSSIAATVLV